MIHSAPVRHVRTLLIALIAGLPLATGASAALAQGDSAVAARPPLFTRDDAYLGAAFVVGTIALTPFDQRLTSSLQAPRFQDNRVLRGTADFVRTVAVPGAPIIGGSLYLIGRLGRWKRVADLGLHGTEAILVGNIVNTAIKGTVGRARPYAVADSNSRDFQLFRGFRKGRDYSSFPGGHALAAFAVAAAVSNEASRWWPHSRWYVGTAMYGGATAVALSRLYNDQHWASDVIMAAGIGTFAGNKVVRYHHRTDPGNRLDRWLLAGTIAPRADGSVALVWTIRPGAP